MSNDRPRCHCGVYVDRHQRADHKPRRASRLRLWFQDHSIRQHLLAPIWVRIPEKRRWDVVHWLNKSDRRCWCDLVEAALVYREKDDCDTRIPFFGAERAQHCATVCGFMHDHAAEGCRCYCGKFEILAAPTSPPSRLPSGGGS